MTIQGAKPSDAAQIMPIWNKVIRETTITFNPTEKTVEEVSALIAQDCLVWDDKGQVLGFARYFPFRGGEGYRFAAEHTVMIRDDAQGRGVGTGLMKALCARAKAADKHHMIAGCSAEHPAAIGFHAHLGFQKVATLPEVGFKFGRWIDLVLMQKRL
ncbi:MAG: N-acetyltransferase family protein [Pseudomonadota bacterium]